MICSALSLSEKWHYGSFPPSKTLSVVSLQWPQWDQASSRTTGLTIMGRGTRSMTTGGQKGGSFLGLENVPHHQEGHPCVCQEVCWALSTWNANRNVWTGPGVGGFGVPSNYESLLFLMIIFNLFQQIPASHLFCVHACIRNLFHLCLSYPIIVETTNSMWHFAIHNVLLSSAYFDMEPKQCCGISMAGFIMPVS